MKRCVLQGLCLASDNVDASALYYRAASSSNTRLYALRGELLVSGV